MSNVVSPKAASKLRECGERDTGICAKELNLTLPGDWEQCFMFRSFTHGRCGTEVKGHKNVILDERIKQ